MELNDLVLVSTDDHVVEPPGMFDGRLPKRLQDGAPRVVDFGNGKFNWIFAGDAAPSLTTSARPGRPVNENNEPTSYADIRPGTYDIHERVKDMDANGVLGSLCFPSFPRFAGQLFANAAKKEPDLSLAVVRAYNDWHLEEWVSTYPGRFIPCAVGPIWDPVLMAAEMRRVHAQGCQAVSFSMNPYMLGLPSLHDDHWDPFWQVCDELGIVVCLHIGSGSYTIQTSPDAPQVTRLTCSGINIFSTAADLVWASMMRKFPNLTFALSEGGIGWVPYFLEWADFVYRHHVEHLADHFLHGERPSERFRARVVTCFIEDAHGVRSLDSMNIDNVTWECDYPHPDSCWPNSPESAWAYMRPVLDDLQIDKITHLNAMRIFKFDPFSIRPKEQSTVGALRAHVPDHDVTFVPGHQYDLGRISQGESSNRRKAASPA